MKSDPTPRPITRRRVARLLGFLALFLLVPGALIVVLLSVSCTLIVPGYRVARRIPRREFLAGAARVDITPPPCYPTGGHGPAGAVAKGYWNRLYARVFYFEGGNGSRLVLVSADLFALPAGLHAAVARRVHRDKLPIAPQEIILAATHTHHGPGNFTSEKVYNQFGSPYPGFDRGLFEFLVDSIAGGIKAAAVTARPSSVSFKVGRADRVGGQTTEPFIRNRIPETVMLNPDRDQVMDDLNPDLSRSCESLRLCADKDGNPIPASSKGSFCERELGWDIDGCPRLRMADETLKLLEVRRDGAIVAALVFFAVHPTALLPNTPVNSSDLFGVAAHQLERELPTGAVVGLFNGPEGDITARRLRRDFKDVVRLGRRLAESVRDVMNGKPEFTTFNPDITTRHGTVELSPENAGDGGRSKPRNECGIEEWKNARLAEKPRLGAAGLGGAEDDRTVLFDLGFREGMRAQPEGGQGPKLAALDSPLLRGFRLTQLFAPPTDFPAREMEVTVAELGSVVLVAVPVEMTTAMGYRIRKKLNLDSKQWVLIGLANGYSSYVTTPDEYVMQEYVGASTIWGPEEGPSIGCAIDRIRGTEAGVEERASSKIFNPGPGPAHPFGPLFCGDVRQRPDEELGNVLLESTGRPARSLPWFEWIEPTRRSWICRRTLLGIFGFCKKTQREDFASTAKRRVRMFVKKGSEWTELEDDRGEAFVTSLLGEHDAIQQWSALWLSPVLRGPLDPEAVYHFRVDWTAGSPPPGSTFPVCSKPFILRELGVSGSAKVIDGPCPPN